MDKFQLVSDYKLSGDQPEAVDALVKGIESGMREQTLMGVTGSGKTFTMANVIARINRPTLVLAHNKILAAQLCSEFKEFFPNNAVEYFVSYYDYYQPEAYVPSKDVYIEKDSSVNDEIDKLRHSATSAIAERRDVIIVASVSCIYSLGDPEEYKSMVVSIRRGMEKSRDRLIADLVGIQYERNDINFVRNKFRVRGDVVEIFPANSTDTAIRVEFFGDEIDRITEINVVTGEVLCSLAHAAIFPASHYIVSRDKMHDAIEEIKQELDERIKYFKDNDMLIEAQRIAQRTNYDIEMLEEIGFCSGIENYSRVLARRPAGSTPFTLLDFLPEDFVLFVDESHVSLPQVRGMYAGDRARKQTLVDYGFRLPSAMDNAGNTSEIYKTANPYYTDPENKDSSEKDPAQQLPVDASATKPSSATAQVTEHTKTDVNGNTVSQTDSGTTSSSSATAKQSPSTGDTSKDADQSSDSQTTEKGKEFYTIQTASEKVFYLVIDRDGEDEKVYFLTEVSENDLLNTTTDNSETLPKNSAALESAIPTKDSALSNNNADTTGDKTQGAESVEDSTEDSTEDTSEPKEDTAKADGSGFTYVLMGIAAVAVIEVVYVVKSKKKKENFIDEDEDEDELDEDYDYDDEEETEQDSDEAFINGGDDTESVDTDENDNEDNNNENDEENGEE